MALLRIKNLKKSYTITKTQKQDVLKGVDIEFKHGDLVALLGESGCGKSTLINILGGLDMDYTGSVVIKGDYIRDFSDAQLDEYRKKRVGLIFQNYNLIGHATILENVELAMVITDIDEKVRRERAHDLLKMVGLGNYPDKYPSQLSGGQKQRVAIARALANNPTVILADEPTGALDKDTADIVLKILKKVAESGKLVIIVTHSQKVAEECGRILRMDDGVIVEDRFVNRLHIDKKQMQSDKKADKEIIPGKMRRKNVLKQSIKNVERNGKRSLLSSIGMAVGMVAMLLIFCLSSGLTDYVNDVYGVNGNALDLQAHRTSYSSVTDGDLEAVNEVSGVNSVERTTMLTDADVSYNSQSAKANIMGYFSAYAPTLLYGNIPINKNEIIVGVNFASKLSPEGMIGVIGQTLEISANNEKKDMTIVGIYDNDSNNLCYVKSDDMEDLSKNSSKKDNYLLIALEDVTYVSAAVSDIKALGYEVIQQENQVEDVLEYIDMGTSVLTGVGAVSMVVSAIMIFIVLYISVSERIKEIGIMRSIGARKRDIKRMFLYEAGIMGLISGIMAVVICFLLTLIVNIICSVTISYSLIAYNFWYYLFGIALSTGISMLAGIAPAIRAAELDPVEYLRAE